MERLDLTSEELEQLDSLNLKSYIINTESKFYLYNNKLLKIYLEYFYNDYKNMEIRFNIINDLVKFLKEINIHELVTPEKLITINGKFAGILIPRIYGKNVSAIINSTNVPLNIKIEILKQIGIILEKIKNIDSKYNAAFADVHGDNFMVSGINYQNLSDKSNIKTFGIDTEGMKFFNHTGNSNYYFGDNANLDNLDKYEANYAGLIIPSTNTDIFCYVNMILEFIAKDNEFHLKNIDEFKRYLDYLDKLDFDGKLLEAFASIYKEDTPNISPLPYLDTINNLPEKTLKKLFR